MAQIPAAPVPREAGPHSLLCTSGTAARRLSLLNETQGLCHSPHLQSGDFIVICWFPLLLHTLLLPPLTLRGSLWVQRDGGATYKVILSMNCLLSEHDNEHFKLCTTFLLAPYSEIFKLLIHTGINICILWNPGQGKQKRADVNTLLLASALRIKTCKTFPPAWRESGPSRILVFTTLQIRGNWGNITMTSITNSFYQF